MCSCSVVTKSRLLFIFGVRVPAAPAHQVRDRRRRSERASEGGRRSGGVGGVKTFSPSRVPRSAPSLSADVPPPPPRLPCPSQLCLSPSPASSFTSPPLSRRLSARKPSAYVSLACVKKRKRKIDLRDCHGLLPGESSASSVGSGGGARNTSLREHRVRS